jgi:signal transduction histidine kinase
MKHWRMRTTLMVSLLAVSLGLTATCLLIIRISVQQEIRKGLDSDLDHSLSTFRNIARQRNEMLSREAALLADLPSLKALMTTQDAQTIQDGSPEFWTVSGSDFFALSSQNGRIFTHLNRGPTLDDALVSHGLQACMADLEDPCLIAFGKSLYELSIRPLYFGSPANDSQLGYVIIGYAIDHQVAQEATTLSPGRLPDLRLRSRALDGATGAPQKIQLDQEAYLAAASALSSVGQARVEIVVLKSYDRASQYLRRVNQWVLGLGLSSLLIGLMLAAAISRTVTRPLEALVAGARALGQGDFTYSLTTEGAVEVRELSLTFDRMRGELKRTQAELIESDRLATIGRMASSVSHDLRHHLSAIYANAEFMSLAQTGNEERLELLLEVREAVQGMTDLIESLLLFSQTGQALNLRHESITMLVERVLYSVRQHPECREVQILAVDLKSVDAWVDGKKLGRALYNLVLNACQAARHGGGQPTVTVTLTEDDERLRIGISDTGNGVPASIRRTLFQPFVSAGKENGVGLGLTLAQHIAQEHGGEVKLERSTPGETTFSVILYKRALLASRRAQVEAAAAGNPEQNVKPADSIVAGVQMNQEQL